MAMRPVSLSALCALIIIISISPTNAAWVPDGIPVAPTIFEWGEGPSRIVSDGSGGAIIVWHDSRSGNNDIYAQRVNASGAVEWTANGVAVCTAANSQQYPQLVSDGSGGAIITWLDFRSGNYDIYAQRIDGSGAVKWTVDGIAVCTAANAQETPQLVSDGSGGAIVTWRDSRSGNNDIYAQRVNASGAVEWTVDGVAVCTAANSQETPQLVSDGSGGGIVTWQDYRSETSCDVYAQRVNASGAVQWTANGVAICTAANIQRYPQLTSDGSGGAIVTWQDSRSGNNDIYAQRVNASGAVQWTVDGIAVCTAANSQETPQLVSDGSGGAIVTWRDYRSGTYDDVYAQRVNASGAVQWTADGVAVCAAADSQYYPQISPDGSGGAIVVWQDYRSGTNNDVYAQRVNASGAVQWTANGVAICTAANSQRYPQLTSDGSGGAIVTWSDYRSGFYTDDVYAQRVNASGTYQWTGNGVAVCIKASDQANPQLASDGSGGAIVTWQDNRSGIYTDVYVQRIDASGTVQWTVDGVAVCTAANYQQTPQLVSDGSGGAIVTWQDSRSGNNDIYAQRVNASGAVEWTANGVAVCTAANSQQYPQLVSDGSGGAIVAWQDNRSGLHTDVYVQRIDASGAVEWTVNGVAICTAANIQRYPQLTSDGSGGAIVTWQDFRSGNYDIYAQRIDGSGAVQWTVDGIAVCTAANAQETPQLVSDGSGGAIITWLDFRSGFYTDDVYAQRVNASGAVQWTADGVAICTAANDQEAARIVSDGSGGAIITWQDYRSGTNNDVYAQRIDASGAVQWTANGVSVCMAANAQDSPRLISDGSGGAIIAWQDIRSGSYYDIYAQRMNAGGAVQWTANGVAVCTAVDNQQSPQLTSDNSGGATITWTDFRGTFSQIYALRTTDSGLGPLCGVEPLAIDFAGPVPVGSSRDTTFAITNEGLGTLIGYVGETCDQFSIVSGAGSFFIDNSESHIVTVRYQPTAPGTHDCTVETGIYLCGDVSISGTAVQLPPDYVIFVDADAAGAGDGSSWADAFTDLNAALAYAPGCPTATEIWVAEGTYRPTSGSDRAATFQLLSDLAIYGGFAGTEALLSERDISAHATILSGDIGTQGEASDNSYNVVTGSGTDGTAVLDGFTVTGGKTDRISPSGGGMYNNVGSPTLRNLIFTENAALHGGGMYNRSGSHPILVNVVFLRNTAEIYGGGMYNSASSPLLINVTFACNRAEDGGGGMGNNTSSMPQIVNTIMWEDSTESMALPEIINLNGSSPIISYSLIFGCGGSGGGWDSSLGTDGGGNIDADPLYYDSGAGDMRLLVGSPAIDAGDSTVSGLPATDIAGNDRIQGAEIDMGAWEGGISPFYSDARMDSLVDVPDDQGGWLRIYFARSIYDDPLEPTYPIERYGIHRRVDDVELLARIKSEGETVAEDVVVKLAGGGKVSLAPPASDAAIRYVRYADRVYLVNEAGAAAAAPPGTWEVVGDVPAGQQDQYIVLAPTLADSAATLTWSVFYISAHTTTPSVYFDSPPDSGYSVDNIAPGVPEGFMVACNTGSGNHLTWDSSSDGDFQYFKVYRGTDPDFVPAPENLVHSTAGTEWSDPEYDGWDVHYKITALDYVGNESDPASPESITGADDQPLPRAYALHQNAPNPFNPVTEIRYDVPPGGGKVTIRLYDVAGRLVRTLVDEAQEAGQRSVRWDGRNDGGQGVASGVYFCRMTAPGFEERRKMVLLR